MSRLHTSYQNYKLNKELEYYKIVSVLLIQKIKDARGEINE